MILEIPTMTGMSMRSHAHFFFSLIRTATALCLPVQASFFTRSLSASFIIPKDIHRKNISIYCVFFNVRYLSRQQPSRQSVLSAAGPVKSDICCPITWPSHSISAPAQTADVHNSNLQADRHTSSFAAYSSPRISSMALSGFCKKRTVVL